MTDFELAKALTVEMVRAASVTNTDGERAFPAVLHSMISRDAYFAAHPDQVWIAEIANDPQHRGAFRVRALHRFARPVSAHPVAGVASDLAVLE